MDALVEEFLPWLAAFFLLDAFVQPRRGQVVFARAGLEGYRLLGPGLHLAAVLPFGAELGTYELPFLPTREGLWTFDPDAKAAPPVVTPDAVCFLPWSALTGLQAEGLKVLGAGRVLFRARSPRAARMLAAELERLRATDEGAREAELGRWREARFDVAAARARWKRVRLPTALAATFGTLVFLVLFAALPALALLPGAEARDWERALAVLGASHLGALGAAAWALARSGARGRDVAGTLSALLLLPTNTARAGIHALRDAFADLDPLAVAAVVLPRAAFLRWARREFVRTEESREATRALGLAPFWEARRLALERCFAGAGTSVTEVLAPPASPPDAAAFCPLCAAEYRQGFARCSDCDIALASRLPSAP